MKDEIVASYNSDDDRLTDATDYIANMATPFLNLFDGALGYLEGLGNGLDVLVGLIIHSFNALGTVFGGGGIMTMIGIKLLVWAGPKIINYFTKNKEDQDKDPEQILNELIDKIKNTKDIEEDGDDVKYVVYMLSSLSFLTSINDNFIDIKELKDFIKPNKFKRILKFLNSIDQKIILDIILEYYVISLSKPTKQRKEVIRPRILKNTALYFFILTKDPNLKFSTFFNNKDITKTIINKFDDTILNVACTGFITLSGLSSNSAPQTIQEFVKINEDKSIKPQDKKDKFIQEIMKNIEINIENENIAIIKLFKYYFSSNNPKEPGKKLLDAFFSQFNTNIISKAYIDGDFRRQFRLKIIPLLDKYDMQLKRINILESKVDRNEDFYRQRVNIISKLENINSIQDFRKDNLFKKEIGIAIENVLNNYIDYAKHEKDFLKNLTRDEPFIKILQNLNDYLNNEGQQIKTSFNEIIEKRNGIENRDLKVIFRNEIIKTITYLINFNNNNQDFKESIKVNKCPFIINSRKMSNVTPTNSKELRELLKFGDGSLPNLLQNVSENIKNYNNTLKHKLDFNDNPIDIFTNKYYDNIKFRKLSDQEKKILVNNPFNNSRFINLENYSKNFTQFIKDLNQNIFNEQNINSNNDFNILLPNNVLQRLINIYCDEENRFSTKEYFNYKQSIENELESIIEKENPEYNLKKENLKETLKSFENYIEEKNKLDKLIKDEISEYKELNDYINIKITSSADFFIDLDTNSILKKKYDELKHLYEKSIPYSFEFFENEKIYFDHIKLIINYKQKEIYKDELSDYYTLLEDFNKKIEKNKKYNELKENIIKIINDNKSTPKYKEIKKQIDKIKSDYSNSNPKYEETKQNLYYITMILDYFNNIKITNNPHNFENPKEIYQGLKDNKYWKVAISAGIYILHCRSVVDGMDNAWISIMISEVKKTIVTMSEVKNAIVTTIAERIIGIIEGIVARSNYSKSILTNQFDKEHAELVDNTINDNTFDSIQEFSQDDMSQFIDKSIIDNFIYQLTPYHYIEIGSNDIENPEERIKNNFYVPIFEEQYSNYQGGIDNSKFIDIVYQEGGNFDLNIMSYLNKFINTNFESTNINLFNDIPGLNQSKNRELQILGGKKRKRPKTIKKYKYKKNKTGKRKNGKKGKRNNNTPKLMNAKKSNKKMTISQILINNLKN